VCGSYVHIATFEVSTSVKIYIVVWFVVTDVSKEPDASFLRIIVPPNKFVHAVMPLTYIRRPLVRVFVETHSILNKVLRDFH
jgi:hypothetical protein